MFKDPGKKTWWYEFHFAGQKVRESAKSRSKEIARPAENARRRELEESYHGLKNRVGPKPFNAAPDDWLGAKKPTLAERSYQIELANLKHLRPVFGKQLISDIGGAEISRYQQDRLEVKASPKTINLEIGTLCSIMRRNRLWAEIQPDVRMLLTRDDVGRAITLEEEKALLAACGQSRSRSLLPAVTLAVNTCMRYSEIRLLHWSQIDLINCAVTVWKEQEQLRYREGDSTEHSREGDSGVLGEQLPGEEADRLCVPERALRRGGRQAQSLRLCHRPE